MSKAGYWAVLISIPIFQFLLFRWLWRYLIWMILLFRLSKTQLNLLATHADRAGGMGIIMLAQKSFNLVFVAGSVVLSGQLIMDLQRHPDQFITIRNETIGYVVIALIILLVPLLFFSIKLLRAKNNGLEHLSTLGCSLSSKFEKEWTEDSPIDKRIDNNKVDPSMLYDYMSLYEQIEQLRIVPATIREVAGMAILLFIPFVPIFFVHFSVKELLQKIGGMLT